MPATWNPWRGCRKYSDGCQYCYIHKGDAKRGIETGRIFRTDRLSAPVDRKPSGEYKMKPGQLVYLCFSSDFFLADADPWREECWAMIRERQDLHFLFLTKRIERFYDCIPDDWGGGYENVTIGCTVENQRLADDRLSLFTGLPVRHKNVICQPLLERIEIGRYLEGVELVVAGGESDRHARPLDYEWVLNLRNQCALAETHFEFRQCGTHFIKDGRHYVLKTKDLCSQARKADIDF